VSHGTTTAAQQGPAIDAQIVSDIFAGALLLARRRLTSIGAEDVEDTISFDRAARTALSLVRVASEVDALSVRKRKETTENARSGALTDTDIDRHEQELAGRLSRYARELSERLAEGSGAAGAGDGAGGGA
jgi:hypothetical protein